MKRLAAIVAFAIIGCAHAIRTLDDCERVKEGGRIECAACTLRNKAEKLIGSYQFKPDNPDGQRCVRVE
jgi:hypothetical protein